MAGAATGFSMPTGAGTTGTTGALLSTSKESMWVSSCLEMMWLARLLLFVKTDVKSLTHFMALGWQSDVLWMTVTCWRSTKKEWSRPAFLSSAEIRWMW